MTPALKQEVRELVREENRLKAMLSRQLHECETELDQAERNPAQASRSLCELKARFELASQIMQQVIEIDDEEKEGPA